MEEELVAVVIAAAISACVVAFMGTVALLRWRGGQKLPPGQPSEGHSSCCSHLRFCRRTPQKWEAEAWSAFERADADRDGKLSRDEVQHVVAGLPQLWAMLEVNTGIDCERCQEIATTVAMCKLDANGDGSLSWEEFKALWTGPLTDPKCQLEFFHRAMFSAFDADGNQALDSRELIEFLDVYYKEGSIFSGDKRLPPKEELAERAMQKLDRNLDRRLSFKELGPLLTGQFELV